jgi:hypothetical protein
MTDDATIIEGDPGFLGMASRLNPVNLPPGLCQLVENMRLDRGVAQTRKGAKRLADDVAADRIPLALPFTLGTDQTLTSLSFSGGTVTATLTAHGYTTGQILNIRGATEPDYNGDHAITVTDPDTFTYNITGTPTTPATGTLIANDGPIIQSSYDGGIFASCVFSNPNIDDAREYIALASTDRAYLWREGSAVIEKTFPTAADELIESGDEISMLQAFNRLYIFRRAPIFGPRSQVTTISRTGTTATVTAPAHGFFTGQRVRIDGADPSAFNGVFPITFIDQDSFSYTCPSTITAPSATGTITAEGMTLFGPQAITSGGITVSGTTATIHCTAHGYPVGATVRLEGSATPAFDGVEYLIASVSTDSFEITVPSGTATDATTTGRTVRRVKPALYWDGDPATNFVRADQGIPGPGVSFRHLQSVPWATYFANRLWIPDPAARDTVAISDVLDPDLFDPFFQSFRANAGSADFLVAIHPWVEGQALVFMRRSIWLATLNTSYDGTTETYSIDETVSKLTLITNEIGCSARRSIQTAGNFIYFLSDSGVYRLDTKLDLKVRGDTRPLSEPISDQLSGLNATYSTLAVGAWFDNRYYLALPLGNSTFNNALLIFNALNEQWESRDVYDSTLQLDDLLISEYNGRRRLFASSLNGKLFLLEEHLDGDDTVTPVPGNPRLPVQSRLRTRRYAWGTNSNKRLLRATVDALVPSGGSLTLRAILTNPDRTFDIATLTNDQPDKEDYTVKAPIRSKAHFAELELLGTVAMPSFRTLSIEATRSNFPRTETRTTP